VRSNNAPTAGIGSTVPNARDALCNLRAMANDIGLRSIAASYQ
jgi:hypothetical protein